MDRRRQSLVDNVVFRLRGNWFPGYTPSKREAETVAIHALVNTKFDTVAIAMEFIRQQREKANHDLEEIKQLEQKVFGK